MQAGDLRLQFTGDTVFAPTAKGIYQKRVDTKAYGFLRPDQPEKP